MDDDGKSGDGYQYLGVKSRRQGFSDVILTSSLTTYSWGPIEGTPRISFGIGPRSGLFILGTRLNCEIDSKTEKMASQRWKSLRCNVYNTVVPTKLLYGPWTTDQLSFLQALIDAGSYLDPVNKTQREIAKRGLTEAIREGNYRAVDLLTSGLTQSQYNNCHNDKYFEPSFSEADFVTDIFADDRDWVEYPEKHRSLDIVPDTENLRIAVVESGCRKNNVKRLLGVWFSDIDRTSPAVVAWAKKKEEQGDVIGQ